MIRRARNVLFLCTGNSARSIMAESILNRVGAGRYQGFSAGSYPLGAVNPYALALLARQHHRVEKLRSKSWGEFARDDAPQMDFVITVCDHAAGEVCPIWPGHPITAHWGLPDPAAVTGNEIEITAAFERVYQQLVMRLEHFVSLPIDSLQFETLAQALRDIGALDQAATIR